MKKAIYRLFGLAILVAAGWGGYRFVKQLPERQETIATAKVQKGDVVIRAFSRGELRAVRSYSITAPNLFGTVQVTRLAPMGALSHEKDLIVEYDDSERQASLEEAKLSVQSVDESIKQLKANQSITQSQDAVNLLKARYDVRRAELEVKKNDIIDVIDAKKNILMLDQSKRALQQLESDIQARQEQADSQLAVYREQRNRSQLDVVRELQRIAQTKALTPITGLVAVKQNRAGYFNFGQQLPDIREGDQLMPGMPVADVLDLSEVEVWAKVGELDRANLREGQDAILQLDAIPDKQFHGRIKAMSGTATADVFSGDPSKKFDVIFAVDMRQLLGSLGMKPAEIERIMTTAAANAKKNVGTTGPSLLASMQAAPGAMPGMPGAMPGMPGMQDAGGVPGMPAGMPGGQDAQDQGGGRRMRGGDRGQGGGRQADGQKQGGAQDARGGEGRGGGRGGMTANLSDEERQKVRQAMGSMSDEQRQKMRGLIQQATNGTPEERRKLMDQLTGMMGGEGGGRGRGEAGGRGDAGARGGRGQAMPEGTGRAGDNTLQMLMQRYSGSQFSEQERNDARLPLPPEQDSQVQALLRPGLLADVEIVVEKIPDAIHLPRQAVFTKSGKSVVFVQQKNGRFEPREVQISKQSESMMVLTGGVKPGETVALSDPTADKSGKKDKGDKKSQANPMGSMPGGK
jgi:multidrug resistance efflux pump